MSKLRENLLIAGVQKRAILSVAHIHSRPYKDTRFPVNFFNIEADTAGIFFVYF